MYDPDRIEAGKLRYLGSFLAPPGATQNQDSFGRPKDAFATKFQAYVALEGDSGRELIVADQIQANTTFTCWMRWSYKALAAKSSWQMSLKWPGSTIGAQTTTRVFELIEPPRDPTGKRKKLVFQVKERVAG